MQTKVHTSKEYFAALTVLYAAFFVTQILFGLAVCYADATGTFAGDNDVESLNYLFQIMVPVFMLASYIGSSILVKMQMKNLKQKPNLKSKLMGYRSILLIKFALLEFPTLFALVCFVITSNYFFLGLAMVMVVLFLFNRPTHFRTAEELELTPSERVILENPDSIVV